MVRVVAKGVNTVRKRLADGTVRIYRYHRATGMQLPGDPMSTEFLLAWARAEQLGLDRLDGKFSGLVRDFTAAVEFRNLAESTQKSYRRSLVKAEERFSTLPIAALADWRIREDFKGWRSDVAGTSGTREADNRFSAVSAMLSWAVEHGRLQLNHLKGAKRLHHSDRSEIIWLPEHVQAFWTVAPVEMQRAMVLALHTGLRQADILHLPWSAYDGTHLTVRIRKNRRNGQQAKPTTIRCTKALRQMLDGMPRVSPLVLATKTDRAFKARYFGRRWEETTIKAGLTEHDLHFNDLRGTAITMLAEAGNTVPEICSVTGHSLPTATKILERYLAQTKHMADQAIGRFENAKATEFANRLQTGPQPEASRRAKGEQ